MKRIKMKKPNSAVSQDGTVKTRECKKPKGCGKIFPLTEEFFHQNAQQTYGLHLYCKSCRSKHRRLKYKQDKSLKKVQSEQKSKSE